MTVINVESVEMTVMTVIEMTVINAETVMTVVIKVDGAHAAGDTL
jgi:hypothetical protein